MPMLVKFMLRHALIGGAAALVFVAAVLAMDVGGLRTLIIISPSGTLAVALLTFFTALTFGGLQIGIAVMSLREKEEVAPDGDHLGGDRPGDAVLQPVRVRVTRRR